MLNKTFLAPDFHEAEGGFVRLERLDWSRHLAGLFACLGGRDNAAIWRWLGDDGPYDDAATFQREFEARRTHDAIPWQTVVIRDVATQVILGMASYMRIRPPNGSVEVGAVTFSFALQRTPHATEAMYLMMRYAFDTLGYRRYEWKCNDKNAPSMRAALRLGFTYEGTFRQDAIAKGENRDTAWYSVLDSEWPRLKAAFEAWLAPDNFTSDGTQRVRLEALREALAGVGSTGA